MSTAIQDIYTLTPTQQGILFHSLSSPGGGLYVVQIAFTLGGQIDNIAEERAWTGLIERHDILRTAFAWEKQAAPLQVVGRSASLSLKRLDLTGLSGKEQQAEIQSYLEQDRVRGFDLRNAPLFRVASFTLTPITRRVILTFHHIILDGWSIPLLLRDWLRLYNGDQLPAAAPFRDYLVWLKTQDRVSTDTFWRQELQGVSAATDLPIPAAPKGTEPGRGESLLVLPPDIGAKLQSLAKTHRLTMGTLVHGLWAILLSRYSGEDDVLYGLTRSGRPAQLAQVDSRIGMFINTLPMRARIEHDRPLLHWLIDLQFQQQRQQPHEHASLVSVHAASSIPQGGAFMRSVVVYENYPMDQATGTIVDGISVDDVDIQEQTSFPLSLFAVTRESLELRVLYDKSLYDPNAIERLTGHLEQLFKALVENPAQQIADLPLLSDVELQHLEDIGRAEPAVHPWESVSAIVAKHVHAQPENIAVIAQDITLDYATLDRRANQLAQYLLNKGATPGTAIGLCLTRSVDIPVAVLAILRAGCHYLPLDPSYPTARLGYYLEDSGARLIICHTATKQLCAGFEVTNIDLDMDAAAIAQQPGGCPAIEPAAQDAAYLIYTSGSTGKPKGVTIPHRALDNLLASFARIMQNGSDLRFLAVTTLSFDIATLEILLPLITGGTLVLPQDQDVRNPARLAELIDTHDITQVQATPSTWRLMVGSGWSGHKGLSVLCGGEALDGALARALEERCKSLWNVYGPTETTIWSTALRLTPDQISSDTAPIGQPIGNTTLHVLDARGRKLPIGIPGELYIGGMGLSSGYHGQAALTRERFVEDPFQPSDGTDSPSLMYRTGDRVRYRLDGNLDYLGRFDQQAKLRGHRLEIGEIEAALSSHPAVRQAVVIIEGEGERARLVAFLQPAENQFRDDAEIRRHAALFLPAIMVPAVYQFIESLPLTLNGKVDRKALASLKLLRPQQQTNATTPQMLGEPAATLAAIWQQVLHVERVGPQDNFFELGGHSLLIIPVQDAIRLRLNVSLDMVDLFRFPTLQTLAEHITAMLSGEAGNAASQRTETRVEARVSGKDRLRQRFQQNRQQVPPDHA